MELSIDGGVTRARFPRRRLDGVAIRELYEAAVALTDRREPKLLIDLAGVEMLSSGAVGIFLSIRKKYLQYGGQVHLACDDAQVRQSLEVMHVHRVLRIFPTADEAAAAFK